MVELRKLRGKSVLVSGGNAENDLLELYPELFSYRSIEQIFIEFPNEITFSLTSPDYVDSDYKVLSVGRIFTLNSISVQNIKIKSATEQTGYIFTAGI